MPSESNCTVVVSGEEDEVLELAVAHVVSRHGHTDGPELRATLREEQGMQLVEFHTGDLDRFRALADDWREGIGRETTATWALITADRDRADTYVELVGFPDHAAAMRNSEHPVTTDFAKRLQEATDGEAHFRDLDVRDVLQM